MLVHAGNDTDVSAEQYPNAYDPMLVQTGNDADVRAEQS